MNDKKSRNTTKSVKGFTLVELSIVLVIIGLIVSGVVGGQSLIHSAKINQTVSQVQQYKTAINTFGLQYNALPGDMIDGYEYWGNDCLDSGSDTQREAICNGDGNNLIRGGNNAEGLMSWRHLQLAGILSGSLTGDQDNSGAPMWANIGSNLPAAPFEGTGFAIDYYGWGGGWPVFGRLDNSIILGSVVGHYLTGGGVTPADATALDKKIDDGSADSGDVRAGREDAGGYLCTGGDNPGSVLSGSYDLTNTNKVCRVFFY